MNTERIKQIQTRFEEIEQEKKELSAELRILQENPEEFLNAYGHIIIDECHHIPAVSFESVLKKCPARYVLGLTATPYRKDGHQAIIHMQCGPIRHEMAEISDMLLAKKVIVREMVFRMPLESRPQNVDIEHGKVRLEHNFCSLRRTKLEL